VSGGRGPGRRRHHKCSVAPSGLFISSLCERDDHLITPSVPTFILLLLPPVLGWASPGGRVGLVLCCVASGEAGLAGLEGSGGGAFVSSGSFRALETEMVRVFSSIRIDANGPGPVGGMVGGSRRVEREGGPAGGDRPGVDHGGR
jgi:hypothetical protein